MKRFIIIASLFLFSSGAYAAIDDNLDYDFINSAFSDKQYSNQEFEKVMKQYEKPREGLFTKIYKYFDRDKVKYDENFKKKYEDANNQPLRIKDTPEDKPTVLISADSVDSNGNTVPVGYYQVGIKKQENGKYVLELMQGSKNHVATLIAREMDEDEKAPSIVYSRAETTQNGFIKVICANIDITLIGYLKIKETENKDFITTY